MCKPDLNARLRRSNSVSIFRVIKGRSTISIYKVHKAGLSDSENPMCLITLDAGTVSSP